ncbi:hypothetical protein C3K47_05325 [Solitalea longa]|uniref:chitinase n=1 Tax=Solitalea longa TaxID=2079460 RepID=A0A2S5A5X8_9SPHI|nr:glycosyl hydrolase family 18 protein [Solitalea longa]POY37945.1 hypothetical protein C3K47_05325 [Solitalea longa]
MKRLLYFLIPVLLFAVVSSCEKEYKGVDDEPIYPRIFDNKGVFRTPSRIISEGESAVYNGITYSPSGGMSVSWLVNDVQVSTDTAYTFKPTEGGEYTIVLRVTTPNGDTTSRTSKVLVNPTNYTFKTYTNVAMSYLSENGKAADVNWDLVTHLAFKCARVLPEGTLDVSNGEVNQTADEIVARAHINGVPVLLGVSGRLSGIDGWALYGSNDFGSVITDAAKRAALVTAIKNYVTNKRMDGVDIMMTDINGVDVDGNLAAAAKLLTALRAELPATAIVTVTVAAGWQHWSYPDLSAADWVNVHAFEDGLTVGPGAPRGQASSYDYMVSCANIWKNFHLPASKIVVGIPGFGLQYNAIDANGNNESWGSYGYTTFKEILRQDPAAYEKEFANIAFGIYYNGGPLIDKKTEFIKNNGFKGAYFWGGDYDVAGEKSLMATIHKTLK